MSLTMMAGLARKRRQSADAERAAGIARRQIGDDGLARDRALAFRHQRPHPFRQVDVAPRTEADHADALAGADLLPFAHEGDDAPGDEAGDLHHADAPARTGNEQTIALVVLARLVEIGVEEFAGAIGDA